MERINRKALWMSVAFWIASTLLFAAVFHGANGGSWSYYLEVAAIGMFAITLLAMAPAIFSSWHMWMEGLRWRLSLAWERVTYFVRAWAGLRLLLFRWRVRRAMRDKALFRHGLLVRTVRRRAREGENS